MQKPTHFWRYFTRNQLEDNGVRRDDIADYQTWSHARSIMENSYTDPKRRAMNSPALYAAVGRTANQSHDPIYDNIDMIPDGIHIEGDNNTPSLLKKMLILSLASGTCSTLFRLHFRYITERSDFETFSKQLCAYMKRANVDRQRREDNSVKGYNLDCTKHKPS